MSASLDNLQDWLIAISTHTREMKEALQGRAGAASPTKSTDESSLADRLGKRIEEAMRSGLATGLGQARSLAARGFAGTAEQAQNQYQMDMLGRQFAAVMMPVMQGMTYLAAQVEMRMRGMSGSEQNRLMGGIIGGGLGLRYGGAAGGLAGFALGSAVLGDGPGGSLSGAAAGAYLGYRAGGPIGAGLGALAGGAAGSPGHYEGERPSEYYARLRAAGGSRAGAAFDMSLHSLSAMWGGRGSPRPEPRRDVTPFQAEMMEAGGTAARVQENLIRATAGPGYEDAGVFKPIIDVLLLILNQLIVSSGGTPVPLSARADA